MKAWLLDYYPPNNTIEFSDSEELDQVYKALGSNKPIIQEWSAPNVEFNDVGKPADILNRYTGALVISRKVKELLEQNHIEHIEFLPLSTATEEEYYILHVLSVIDCIDPVSSKVRTYYDDVPQFDEYSLVLDQKALQGQHIFRIKLPSEDRELSYIYVSDFLQEILSQSIVGYQLVEIWDSKFSWKAKEEKHERMGQEIDSSLLEVFDFDKAKKFARKNKGHMVYSGEWAIKADKDKRIWLGNLQLDGSYSWINPIYYPPILLELQWGIPERSKTMFSRLKESVGFK